MHFGILGAFLSSMPCTCYIVTSEWSVLFLAYYRGTLQLAFFLMVESRRLYLCHFPRVIFRRLCLSKGTAPAVEPPILGDKLRTVIAVWLHICLYRSADQSANSGRGKKQKCCHACLLKQACELNTRNRRPCYWALLSSFAEIVGCVKWKNLLCNRIWWWWAVGSTSMSEGGQKWCSRSRSQLKLCMTLMSPSTFLLMPYSGPPGARSRPSRPLPTERFALSWSYCKQRGLYAAN